MSKNPFEYVNDILYRKQDIIRNGELPEQEESEYNPYIVNKALSQYPDTVHDANNMNLFFDLDNLLQYDFLLNSVRRWKRPYSPWYKKEKGLGDVEVVRQAYGYTIEKAQAALSILSSDQIKWLKKRQEQG